MRIEKKRKELDAHIANAWAEPIEGIRSDKYMVKYFKEFCAMYSLKCSRSRNLFLLPIKAQTTLIRKFFFWLQFEKELAIDFNGARSFVAAIIRKLDILHNPFDNMPSAYLRRFKACFNKNALVKERPKIAMPADMVKYFIAKWCLGCTWVIPPSRNFLLGTALLTYAITALRAGNILLGSSDNRHELAIHVGDIFKYKIEGNIPMLFIINNRSKTSKIPIITPVPYHPQGNRKLCAATRLEFLLDYRVNCEKASSNDFLFINTKSKKPLSTAVFNTSVKKVVKEICLSGGIQEDLSKFFSAISLRKMVTSEMKEDGRTPQEVAKALGHSTLESQLSYMCKHYDKKQPFVRHLYEKLSV